MKKLIFIFIACFGILSTNAQTLKGYSLGGILVNPTIIGNPSYPRDEHTVNTSVAGLEGVLQISALKDGRIFEIIFYSEPMFDNNDMQKYLDYDPRFQDFLKSVTDNYKISFTRKDKNGGFYYKTDNNKFIIDISFMSRSADIVKSLDLSMRLTIKDDNLINLYNKQEENYRNKGILKNRKDF